MRIVKLTEETRKDILENLLKRSPDSYGEYEKRVADIVARVKAEGDQALFDYTARFDGLPEGELEFTLYPKSSITLLDRANVWVQNIRYALVILWPLLLLIVLIAAFGVFVRRQRKR